MSKILGPSNAPKTELCEWGPKGDASADTLEQTLLQARTLNK